MLLFCAFFFFFKIISEIILTQSKTDLKQDLYLRACTLQVTYTNQTLAKAERQIDAVVTEEHYKPEVQTELTNHTSQIKTEQLQAERLKTFLPSLTGKGS